MQSKPAEGLLTSYGSMSLAASSLVLWFTAVHQALFLHMGSLGLISILPWTFFAGLACVVIGLASEMLRNQLRIERLIVLISLLIVFLFGTACAIEPTASLSDSWIHAGFIQYIVQHGTVLNGYDARFSWPGSFSLGALLVAFTGQANALGFLRWFPLFIEFTYLAPVLVIARYSGVGRRTGWLGIALFFASNWIYQDYFSPQALNYLFFLVVIGAVFACLQPRRKVRYPQLIEKLFRRVDRIRSRFTHARSSDYEMSTVWNANVTLAVLGVISVITFASAISHQLTPYALILALAACFLTRRLARPEIIVVASLFAVGWLSLGATDFWVGHLSLIFGSVGQLGSTLGSNVTNRVTGSTVHQFVVDGRIILTLALYTLAGFGALRRHPSTRTLEALAAVPFVLVAAQDYGGEGLLRVVFFGLPFTTLLAASTILPNPMVHPKSATPGRMRGRFERLTRRSVLVTVLFGFAFVTTFVRGGNDSYQTFTTGEVAAANFAYAHARTGQSIAVVTYFVPLGQRDVGTVKITAVSGGSNTPSVSTIEKSLVRESSAYVLLSRAQEAWGEIVAGYAKGWESQVEHYLVQHGYILDRRWSTATVLNRRSQPVAGHYPDSAGHFLRG